MFDDRLMEIGLREAIEGTDLQSIGFDPITKTWKLLPQFICGRFGQP